MASNPHKPTKSDPSKRDAKGRFGKGNLANPGGRPKTAAHVRDLARQYTDVAIARLAELLSGRDDKVAVAAAKELLDRAWGRAPQSIDLGDNTRESLADFMRRVLEAKQR